jgi:hypothetical protein
LSSLKKENQFKASENWKLLYALNFGLFFRL